MFVWPVALLLAGSPFVADPSQAPAVSKVQLSRGAMVPNHPVGYWAVEDTSLDGAQADRNLGGSHLLNAGRDKTVLIRFGDLRRVLGAHAKIERARLLLTLAGGAAPPLQNASEVLAPWGEGPAFVTNFMPSATPATAAPLSATWRHRRAGEGALAWQAAGARGPADARPIEGVRLTTVAGGDQVAIEGLGPALQRMYDRPYENFGFALSFGGNADFESSQSWVGRPVLEVEFRTEAPVEGPDLAVIRISRTPEHPRHVPGSAHRAVQDGVEVAISGPPANTDAKHWPANGEEVTYSAVIRNLGSRPSGGFTARWIIRERPGSATEFDRPLGPGEETTLTFKHSYRDPGRDRRASTIGVRIVPKGDDVGPENDGLSIYEAALAVGIRMAPEAAEGLRRAGALGARSAHDFAQAFVALWNETIFPQSRFSHAPEGALERVRLQSMEIGGGDGYDDPNLDVALTLGSNTNLASSEALLALLREFGTRLGLPDLAAGNIVRNRSEGVRIGSMSVERFSQDAWAGLMGGGDTRFEGVVLPSLSLPNEPFESPMFDAMRTEATGLLSATSVGALNDALGRRRGFVSDALMRLPSLPLIRLYDLSGAPIRNAIVEVYPMAGGRIAAAEPLQRAQSDANGSVLLNNRPTQLPEGFLTALGYRPESSVFGRIDPAGSNGVLMLRVIAGGQADTAFLKAWQLADLKRRNPSPAPFFDLRMNIGGDIDPSVNLAANRIVSDSADSLPARLAGLVDDQAGTESELPSGREAWVEIDLGRDRIFGEVRLLTKGPMWEKFRIVTYATGQTPGEARPLAREALWTWTVANRGQSEGSDLMSVSYRTPGLRARFLRIIRVGDGPPGKLAEIKVFPLRNP